ncbi:peptidoglycan DD-metalloendopeptidase family protein [bacterium]|nr:peptidoglycan DD-metalloendopeptidase family protein [bacterium]MBU1024407.1 peptidoglycan DD-metalloendopeptidase family protein [bacterium]
MNKSFIYITSFSFLALVFLGLLGVQSLSYAEVDKGVIDEKADDLKEIKSEKTKLRREIDEKARAKKEAGFDYHKADNDLEYTEKKLVRKVNDLDRVLKQLKIYTNQLDIAEKDLDASQEKFEERIRVYYKNGARGLVTVIVDAEDLSDLVFRIRCTEKLLTDHEATIDNIKLQKDELARLKYECSFKAEEEDKLRSDIAGDRNRVQKLRNEKKNKLSEISSDLKELEKLLQETIKEETEIEFFLEAAAKGNLSTNFDGTFSIPLKSYTLSSGYGMRNHPVFRRIKHHNGQDLAAPYGTPILAAGAGQVIYAGRKGGYGNMVMINHGRGYATLYAHMSSILASDGQEVMEGQPIGKVGSTGLSTGNHLHFEIRLNGKHRNPKEFVSF